MLCRPQLLSLSIHGCDQIKGDWVWKNLDRCKCLDICGTGLNDKDISALRKVRIHFHFRLHKTKGSWEVGDASNSWWLVLFVWSNCAALICPNAGCSMFEAPVLIRQTCKPVARSHLDG